MNGNNSSPSNQDESIREKGRRLLEELEAMGPDLSLVGKTSVISLNGQSLETQRSKEQQQKNTQEENQSQRSQETDSSMSTSRELRALRISIFQEFLAKKDQVK